ncbi:MAG: PAS domain S-box protein, partial [Thermodesulfobacteriota bacterium]|nr:PAS domain S-box protein [Thermodesulfobacteriota bacterium]
MSKKPNYEELKGRVNELEREVVRLNEEAKGLYNSRDYLEKLFNYANAPIIVWDQEGKITRFNHAFEHLTGHAVSDVIGRKLSILFPEASREESLNKIARTLDGEYWESVEIPVLRQDGDTRIALWNSANIYNEDGTTLLATIAQGVDITERREAEKALLAGEERLAGIIASLPDHMSMVDEQHNIVWVNDVAKDLFGSDLIGRKCYKAYHGYDKPCEPCVVMKCFDDGKVHEHETSVTGRDGKHIAFWCTASVVARYADGKPKTVLEVSRNITKRKMAGEMLKESEKKYRVLFETAHDAIFLSDETGKFVDVNRMACKSLKYTKRELLKLSNREIDADPRGYEAFIKARDGVVEKFMFEVNQRKKDGTIFPVEITGSFFMVNDKRISMAISRDITERKQAEEMLRTERDKFQGMLAAMTEGVYIVNQDFIIEYQNDMLKERFGNNIGKKCYEAYVGSDKPCIQCPIQEAIKTGKIEQVEFVATDGRNYETNFAPFNDVDGVTKAIALVKDVTDKKYLQAEAMRVGHLASLGELAAGVAHEINNPINGIINYAEILKCRCLKKEEDEEIPVRIIKEGNRVAQIVKSLLSFASDRRDGLSSVSIQDVFSETLGLAGKLLIKDSIKFSMDLPTDLPMIIANSNEIQQVFLNIISNAR